MWLVTQEAHLMCVCVYVHTNGQRSFSFFFLFFVYTSPNNGRRLLLERRATLLKYLVLQYINRVSKRERAKKNWTTFSRLTIIVNTNARQQIYYALQWLLFSVKGAYTLISRQNYIHTYKVVLDHLLTQQKMLSSTTDINIFTLKWKNANI
jgi:hypothetical protein